MSFAIYAPTELLRAIFSNCLLSDADARFASFSGVDLSNFDFSGADLRFSSFFGINITSSTFCNANLDHSTFKFSRNENIDTHLKRIR
ncbi:MAG: pentapeptide repeat-containing protein [Thermodesulfobacteriota bacterium]